MCHYSHQYVYEAEDAMCHYLHHYMPEAEDVLSDIHNTVTGAKNVRCHSHHCIKG